MWSAIRRGGPVISYSGAQSIAIRENRRSREIATYFICDTSIILYYRLHEGELSIYVRSYIKIHLF